MLRIVAGNIMQDSQKRLVLHSMYCSSVIMAGYARQARVFVCPVSNVGSCLVHVAFDHEKPAI